MSSVAFAVEIPDRRVIDHRDGRVNSSFPLVTIFAADARPLVTAAEQPSRMRLAMARREP